MKTGDLVKEKGWCVPVGDKPRIGIIIDDAMSGFITVLWTGHQEDIVTDPCEVYVISNNGGS